MTTTPGLPAIQRITVDGAASYTVIGTDYLPIPAVDEYLRFLGDDGASPNTARAYATGLAAWFRYLHLTGQPWDGFAPAVFGGFLSWLRTGDLPDTARIGPGRTLLKPATVQLRSAAVLAFYRWQAAAHGLTGPYAALYTPLAKRGRRPYVPFLDGIARGPVGDRPQYNVRSGPRRRTPVLEPEQVRAILDTCSTQRPDGSWSGSTAALRNRFLFATLAETGMRLGEALALRHSDIHLGKGATPAIDVTPRQDHPHGARAKSGQPRRMYVGDDLEALYAAYVWSLVDAQIDMVVPDLPNHFVFVNATSAGPQFAPMRPETVYAAVRSVTRRAAGQIPEQWTPHWLRHTHATALLLSGCPPHVVMRRLGHLDVQTTLSVYGWVTDDAELRAVADWRTYATRWENGLT